MKRGHMVRENRHALAGMLLSLAITFIAFGQAQAAPQYNLTCSSCHGMPPLDSAVRDVNSGAFQGNHQTHQPVNAQPANCAICHNSAGFTTNHENGQISFQSSINNSPKANAQYKVGATLYGGVVFKNQTSVPALGTCSNVNCHFESISPTWGSGKFSYTDAVTNDCGQCHGVPATTGSHTQHVSTFGVGTSTCAICHPNHAAEAAKFAHATSAAPGHRDLSVTFAGAPNGTGTYAGSTRKSYPNYLPSGSGTYGQCSNLYCHGSATATWGVPSTAACGSCHSVNNNLQGKHAKHYGVAAFGVSTSANSSSGTAYTYNCGVCHYKAPHGLGLANPPNQTANIAFSADVAGGGSYVAGSTAYTDTQTTWKYTNGKCSSTYCHSQGKNTFGTYSAPKNTAFDWSTGSVLTCAGCHGGNSLSTSPISSGKHTQHINSANPSFANNKLGCVECHAKTVSDDTTIANTKLHVNKFKEYSGARAGKNAANCSAIYCHSDGKGTYITPGTWASGPAITDCKGCHGAKTTAQGAAFNSVAGEPNYASVGVGQPTSNSHLKHVGSAGASTCDACHTLTTNNGTSIAAGTPQHHLDGNIDVNFNIAKAGGTAQWAANRTCNNISCHNGTSVQWGQAGNCDICHPTASLKGAHAKHLSGVMPTFYSYTANNSSGNDATGKYNFGCSNCHPLVNSNHTNGQVVLDFRPVVAGQGLSTLRTKNSATITTSGVAGVAGGTDATSVPGTKVVCLNVYCHSNGYSANLVYATTPDWYGTGFTGDRCANCHGNSPNNGIAGSAAHGAHVVGIHQDDVFNGTSGKLAAGSTGSVSHGLSAQATTINCNICHNATVTYARNDRNPSCSTTGCHSTPTNLAQINNRANHVNGKVELSFQNIAIVSKAQLRQASFSSYTAVGGYWARNGAPTTPHYKDGATAFDTANQALTNTMWNAGTCSNIACHMGKSVNWYDTTVSCQSCHSRL